jgi:predicted phage tail protein
MLRKIKLYGALAKFIGQRVLEADVATAAEAVRFLLANWPELEAHMNDQHYRVSIGTYDLDLEELHHPAGAAPISFVPVVSGAGAVGRIIAGVALIALAFASGAGFFGAAFAKNIGLFAFAKGIGASLASAASPNSLRQCQQCRKAPTLKTTRARATASAASRTPAARACRCRSSTAKPW